MKIGQLSAEIINQFLKPFHLNPAHAMEAAEDPDQAEALVSQFGLELRIFLKTHRSGGESFTTLVIGVRENEKITPLQVYRIPQKIMLAVDDPTKPLGVLERFANEYGLSITVCGNTGRFFLQQTMKESTDTTWFLGVPKPGPDIEGGISAFWILRYDKYGER